MSVPEIRKFIHIYVPVTTCNLHCHYCYIYHAGLFKNKVPEFKYPPEVVRTALNQKRMGGVCHINMCGGGETLLPPTMPAYIRALLEEGHYLAVVTNGTVTKRFEEIAQFPPELLSRLFFKFSYHYLQLKEKKWLDRFFSNIRMMRDAGCSFTVELTPNDETIPCIEELKQRCIQEVGAVPHITIARNDVAPGADKPILTNLPHDEYYRLWGEAFHSDMFDFKRSIFGCKRREFCYAGLWSFDVDLGSGMMRACYSQPCGKNIFENPESPLALRPVGYDCREPHCYNGHVFLTLGCIPGLEAITYTRLRNRTCADGSEWLKPGMKEFLSQRLYNANRQYSGWHKACFRAEYICCHTWGYGRRVARGILRRCGLR